MNTNLPNLSDNKQILLSAGLNDSIVSKEQTENLYNLFYKTDANLTLKCQRPTPTSYKMLYFMQENRNKKLH